MKTYILRKQPDIETLVSKLGVIDKPLKVTIEPYKKRRSLAQNNLLWMWNNIIKDHISDTTGEMYSDEEVHEFMKAKLLPHRIVEINGEAVRCRKSTSRLSVMEMTDYLHKLDMYCADRLELILPHPEDLWNEAMNGRN